MHQSGCSSEPMRLDQTCSGIDPRLVMYSKEARSSTTKYSMLFSELPPSTRSVRIHSGVDTGTFF